MARPELALSELPLLAPAERHQILVEWNEAALDGISHGTVADLVERRAAEAPGRVAVEGSGESLTYGELSARSDRLARRLAALGLGPEDRVGLLLDRSVEVPVALLGVWKAGAACVPLDPDQPEARLAWLVEDARLAAVVTTGGRRPACIDGKALPVLDLTAGTLADLTAGALEGAAADKEATETAMGSGAPGHLRLAGARPEGLAYLIYTSGTTGRPKAVAVEHASLAMTLAGFGALAPFGPDDRQPLVAPLSFDIALLDLFVPLAAGARVEVLAREEILDLPRLAASVRRSTCMDTVPSVWRRLVDFLRETGDSAGLDGMRRVLVGGERVPPDLLRDLHTTFPRAEVLAVFYGPTEAALICAAWPVAHGEVGERSLLGRPMRGVTLLLLDRWGSPAPVGVPGELHIGGAGVARGYPGREDLTAERFAPSPVPGARAARQVDPDGARGARRVDPGAAPSARQADPGAAPGARLYRTGDLARLAPDGRIEFLGRTDQQVKMRGFRIEPGEIEAALAAAPGGAPGGGRAARGSARRRPPPGRLRRAGGRGPSRPRRAARPPGRAPARVHGARRLRPAAGAAADRPRQARPPGPARARARRDGRRRAPPRTETERLIAGLWAELLGLDRVGIEHDFFDLGGHSLLVTRMFSRLRRILGVDLPLSALFEGPTVAQLAARVEMALPGGGLGIGFKTGFKAGFNAGFHAAPRAAMAMKDIGPPLDGAAERVPDPVGGFPLAYNQRALWFIERLAPGNAAYHIAGTGRLLGPVDTAALYCAMAALVDRHPALRTTFHDSEDGPLQRVEPEPAFDFRAEAAHASGCDEQALAARLRQETRRPFDLERGPLLRLALFRQASGERLLLVAVHHLVADFFSLGVMLRDLGALYAAELAGQPGRPAARLAGRHLRAEGPPRAGPPRRPRRGAPVGALARPARRLPPGAGAARRPPLAPGADLRRRLLERPPRPGGELRPRPPRRGARRYAVHGSARPVPGPARPLDRPARLRRRRADLRPGGTGRGGLRPGRRLLRQSGRDARRALGRSLPDRPPRPLPRLGSRRLRACRASLPAPCRAAPAGARPGPLAHLPGDVRPAEGPAPRGGRARRLHARRRAARARRGSGRPRDRVAAAAGHLLAVRPLPRFGRGRAGIRRTLGLPHRPLRRGDGGAPRRPLRDAARGR